MWDILVEFTAVNVGCSEEQLLFVHETTTRWRKVCNPDYKSVMQGKLQLR